MAGPMTGAESRVIDPILTNVARGYRHAMFAFHYLFPFVPVPQRGGRIITFGAEDFVKRDLVRAPGSNRQRINVGYAGDQYALEQRALDGVVPLENLEEANAVPGVDLGRRAVNVTMRNVSLQIEIAAAEAATKAGTYGADNKSTLAGASQWSHADSKPAQAVEAAKEAIAGGIGVEPNVMVVGPAVFRALRNNADVVDRVKHVVAPGRDGTVVSEETLAAYFAVDRFVVARARSGKPGAFKALWGKNAVLAYSGVSSLEAAEADMGEPGFGYTYRLNGYPIVSEPHFDRDTDSWLYPVTCEDMPVVAGAAAGYLFKDAVA